MQDHTKSSVPNPESSPASSPASPVGGSEAGEAASLASQLRAEFRPRPGTDTMAGARPAPLGGTPAAGRTWGGAQPADEPATKRFSTPWFVLGTTVMVVGFISLMVALDYLPDINWVWVLTLLALAGISLAGGINKVSFVAAGTFFAASLGSVLRQTGRVSLNVEIPVLIMFTGLLILIAMVCKLRTPSMLKMRKAF